MSKEFNEQMNSRLKAWRELKEYIIELIKNLESNEFLRTGDQLACYGHILEMMEGFEAEWGPQ